MNVSANVVVIINVRVKGHQEFPCQRQFECWVNINMNVIANVFVNMNFHVNIGMTVMTNVNVNDSVNVVVVINVHVKVNSP